MIRTVWHWTTLIVLLLVAMWLRIDRLIDLPPGLHYDEAANGILASEIAFANFRPIFITSYTGKETLFFYLAGGMMRLIGDSIFALRLTSAFVGLLTVAASYWLGREIARQLPWITTTQQQKMVGVLTAVLLATHFPHLIFSRLGFRAITQPLLQALTMATLLYALRQPASTARRRLLPFAVAGIWLGLAAYTYLAVRLFPFVVLLFLLPLLRHHWRQFSVTIGVALLTLLPFANFLLRNPDTFWVRISQVSADQPTLTDYTDSLLTSIGILLGTSGDPYWRFNNPMQPFFTPLFAILFVGGLLWLTWRRWSAQTNLTRSTVLLLWATPLIMILPTALAVDEIVPSNLRAIGLYPFVLLPAALLLARLFSRPPLPSWIAPIILLVALGSITYRDYFQRWATRADTYYDSDSDLVAAATYLDTQTTPAYVAALHYRHPTLAFTSQRYDSLKWLVNSEAIVVPPHEAQVVYPHNSPPPQWVADWLGAPLTTETGIDGATLYTVYQLPATPPWPTHPTDVNFSNIVRLIGYDSAETGTSTPTLRLYWEVLATPDRPFAPFVHLVDQTNYRWAQRETTAYPAEQWAVGETIIQEVTFDLPPGMPYGTFTAVIGLFDGNDRLSIVDAEGRFAGTTFRIEALPLAGNPAAPADAASMGQFVLDVNSAETGTRLPLTLHWQLDQSQTYTVWLLPQSADTHEAAILLHSSTIDIGLADQRFVIDRVFPQLPTDLAGGEYQLFLEAGDGRQLLTEIVISETERLFEMPAIAFTPNVRFGEQIRLVGYELSDAQMLTLVWQANEQPAHDYTVFVHILHPDGSCCVWQQDTPPQQGAYPTSRWVTDELIIDTYTFAVEGSDLADLPIEIGLYRPETGQRLPVGAQDYWILEPHPLAAP